MQNKKIVIIGGGPAGCAAGIELLSHGFNPILVEKKNRGKNKLCGGLVTSRAIAQLEKLKIPLKPEVFFRPRTVRFYNSSEKILDYESSKDFFCVRRNRFDNLLLDEYLSRGGILQIDTPVTLIDHNNNRIFTANHESLHFDFLIGADGVNSITTKVINNSIPEPALCLETFIPRNSEIDGINVVFGLIQKGFSWCFENDHTVGIGLGGLEFGTYEDLKQAYNRLFQLYSGFQNNAPKPRAALIPYSGIVKNIAKSNIILTGDAAGFVDPVLGEGIPYALETGILAGMAMATENPIKTYIHLTKNITKRINAGLRLRKLFFNRRINQFVLNEFKKHPGRTAHICDNLVLGGTVGYENLIGLLKIAIGQR